jgi:hypothetical protein
VNILQLAGGVATIISTTSVVVDDISTVKIEVEVKNEHTLFVYSVVVVVVTIGSLCKLIEEVELVINSEADVVTGNVLEELTSELSGSKDEALLDELVSKLDDALVLELNGDELDTLAVDSGLFVEVTFDEPELELGLVVKLDGNTLVLDAKLVFRLVLVLDDFELVLDESEGGMELE